MAQGKVAEEASLRHVSHEEQQAWRERRRALKRAQPMTRWQALFWLTALGIAASTTYFLLMTAR